MTYKNRTVPIEFFVLPRSCQSILDDFKAAKIKFITMNAIETLFTPVKMLEEGFENFGELNSREA